MLFIDVSLIAYDLLTLFRGKGFYMFVSKLLTNKCDESKREDYPYYSTSSLKLVVGCKIQASS
jgi:hypothetical protein